jgi:uncharacterized membrane protein YeaQ/YmgE (transglycosylase-associated protein family)
MNVIVIWILTGGAMGLLGSLLISHMPAGLIGSVVIGMVGGVIAGMLFGQLDLPISAGIFTHVGAAVVGSVILLALSQKLLG